MVVPLSLLLKFSYNANRDMRNNLNLKEQALAEVFIFCLVNNVTDAYLRKNKIVISLPNSK